MGLRSDLFYREEESAPFRFPPPGKREVLPLTFDLGATDFFEGLSLSLRNLALFFFLHTIPSSSKL